MSLYPDVTLPLMSASDAEKRQFEITLLKKRVDALQALVLELLRDRVNYESVAGFRERFANIGFGPSTALFDGASDNLVWQLQQNFPKDKLGWPPPEKSTGN